MFYRLRPPALLDWCGNLPADTPQLAAQYGGDLDRLPWAPSEARPFFADLLRAALRHGDATGQGLVVYGPTVSDIGHVEELLRTHREVEVADAQLPAWARLDEPLKSAIQKSSDRAIRETKERLDDLFAAPVKQELADRWVQLGGRLPE